MNNRENIGLDNCVVYQSWKFHKIWLKCYGDMIVLEILVICLFIFLRNKALKFYFGLREPKYRCLSKGLTWIGKTSFFFDEFVTGLKHKLIIRYWFCLLAFVDVLWTTCFTLSAEMQVDLKTSVIQPAICTTLFSQDVIDAFFSNLK